MTGPKAHQPAGLVFVLLLVLALGLDSCPAQAQTETQLRPIHKISLLADPARPLVPGGEGEVILAVELGEGFKIQSNKPPLKWLQPTTVSFDSRPGLEVLGLTWPEPEKVKFSFADEPLPVFQKTLLLRLRLRLAGELSSGSGELTGRLFYQACQGDLCLPPESLKFSLPLPLAGVAGGGGGGSPMAGPGRSGRSGLAWFALTAFLGGLLLNLTPCCYPLIPVTVAYFGGQGQGRMGVLALAGLYLLGLMSAYTGLGVFAALSGGLLGAALQHPLVLLAVALVLVVLAGSMFDLYEFRVPQGLLRLGGSGRRRGRLGSFFMGLTLGVVAAPCLGPFTLGVLTFVAQDGRPEVGAAVFGSLSLGLGLPLAVLGAFSGRLAGRLPASGEWLVWVRRLLGLILVIMAIYFIRPLLSERVWYAALTLAGLGGAAAAWVTGRRVRFIPRLLAALVALGLAGFWFQAGWKAPAEDAWAAYTPQALSTLLANNSPVILDFYADWCSPCRELRESFADPRVKPLLAGAAALKVDLTDWRSREAEDLRQRYHIRGVPTVIFLLPSGREAAELRLLGTESPADLARRLERFFRLVRPGA